MQNFKSTDEKERKIVEAGKQPFDLKLAELDEFYDNAYSAGPLGDLLWQENRAPLSRAIVQSIFRETFSEVFEAFLVAGSFESYISVFKKIFGDDVEITFTVPDPGKLQIDIVSTGFQLSDFISRYIENNAYVFDEVIDDEGDNIVFQTIKGFQTQYELEQMLREMVPAGVFTEISLTVGEE